MTCKAARSNRDSWKNKKSTFLTSTVAFICCPWKPKTAGRKRLKWWKGDVDDGMICWCDDVKMCWWDALRQAQGKMWWCSKVEIETEIENESGKFKICNYKFEFWNKLTFCHPPRRTGSGKSWPRALGGRNLFRISRLLFTYCLNAFQILKPLPEQQRWDFGWWPGNQYELIG